MMFLEIIKFFQRNQKILFIAGGLGLILGLLAYFFLPIKYSATGSLIVVRQVDNTQDPTYFEYEGYYAQEAARAYTTTVINLFESPDLSYYVAKDLDLAPTKKTLTRLKRNLHVKKKGYQLIELSVSGNMDQVSKTWHLYVTNLLNKHKSFAGLGDQKLFVVPVIDEPIITATFRNIFVNAFVGFGFGVFISTFILAAREYVKNV